MGFYMNLAKILVSRLTLFCEGKINVEISQITWMINATDQFVCYPYKADWSHDSISDRLGDRLPELGFELEWLLLTLWVADPYRCDINR